MGWKMSQPGLGRQRTGRSAPIASVFKNDRRGLGAGVPTLKPSQRTSALAARTINRKSKVGAKRPRAAALESDQSAESRSKKRRVGKPNVSPRAADIHPPLLFQSPQQRRLRRRQQRAVPSHSTLSGTGTDSQIATLEAYGTGAMESVLARQLPSLDRGLDEDVDRLG